VNGGRSRRINVFDTVDTASEGDPEVSDVPGVVSGIVNGDVDES
jgi:hypothetical protein